MRSPTCYIALGCSVILVLLVVSVGLTATEDETDLSRLRSDKISERQRLEREREHMSEVEESLLHGLQQIDQVLSHAEQELSQYEEQMQKNQEQLETLNKELLELQESSENYNQRVARRIRNIYKLRYHGESLNPVKLLLNSEGLGEWLNRYRYLRSITEADQQLLGNIVAQYEQMQGRQKALAGQKHELYVASQSVRESRGELLSRKEQRTRLLDELLQNKQEHDRAIAELERQIHELGQKLGDFSEESLRNAVPGISPRDRGKLPWPVRGQRIPNVNKASRGITIRAPLGSAISAVADGMVRQVEWVLGYGNVMILDHGDAYFSIYAHLSEAVAQTGAVVKKGQTIAKVGETGSLTGPVLYFEIWKGKTPLDTLKWLQRKAN